MDREGNTSGTRTWGSREDLKSWFEVLKSKNGFGMFWDKAAAHVVKQLGNLPNIQYVKKLGLGRVCGLPFLNQP